MNEHESLKLLSNLSLWPKQADNTRRVAMKNMQRGKWEFGNLHEYDPLVIMRDDLPPDEEGDCVLEKYTSFEAMVQAGWRVD